MEAGRKFLLLVEDESLIALDTKQILEGYGYRVHIVKNGVSAVAAVAGNPGIDLVLMDINLGPGIDGTETAALILKDYDLPIVFLSSHVEPAVVAKTEKITSYGYVVKNAGDTVLDASIKMAFKLFEAKIEARDKTAALSHSQRLMQYIIEHLHGEVAVFDREMRYIYVSQSFLAMFQVKRPDVIGRCHYDLFPGLAERIRDAHRRALAGDVVRADDDPFVQEDGRTDWTTWECRPWYEAGGAIGGIILYSEVTTPRKQAEEKLRESEERYRAVFDNSPDAIMLTIPDGGILEANPAAERLFGYSSEELCRMGRKGIIDATDPRLAPALEERSRTGRFFGETAFIRKDGSKFDAEVSSVIFRDREGRARTAVAIRNISDRKRAEEELRKRNQYIEAILDHMPIGFAANTIDDGRVRYMNDLFATTYGWPRDVLTDVERFFVNVYPGSEGEAMKARILDDMRSGDPERMVWNDVRISTQGGGHRYVSARNIPLLEQNLMVSTVWDTTQIHESQEALREAEGRYRLLFEQSPDGIVILDPETARILEFNETAHRQLGYSREEFARLTVSDIEVIETPEITRAHIDRIMREGGDEFETKHRTKDGEIRHILVRARYTSLGGRPIYHCIWRDVTADKGAERALRESEKRLNDILFSMADWVWEVDAAGVYTYSSIQGEALFGRPTADIVGKTPFDLMLPREAERLRPVFREISSRKGVIKDLENWNIGRDGRLICLLTNGVPILDERGELKGYRGVDQDITERKRTETSLIESENKYRALVEGHKDVIFSVSADGRVNYVSPAIIGIYGYPQEDVVGKNLFDFLSPRDKEFFAGQMKETLARGSAVGEYPLSVRDDSTRWIRVASQSVVEREVFVGIRGIMSDITEAKRAGEEIRRQLAEKEILLKEVHHRIKNNIASMSAMLSMQAREQADAAARSALLEAKGRIDSVGILYEKLLLGDGYQDVAAKNYVERLAEAVVSLFPALLKVKLELNVGDFELSRKKMFALGIIINELLTNTLKYAFTDQPEGTVRLELHRAENRVTLVLQDDGIGLPEGFDIEKSGGFGLRLVRMLCEQIDGTFTLKGGAGTRFVVVFEDKTGEG